MFTNLKITRFRSYCKDFDTSHLIHLYTNITNNNMVYCNINLLFSIDQRIDGYQEHLVGWLSYAICLLCHRRYAKFKPIFYDAQDITICSIESRIIRDLEITCVYPIIIENVQGQRNFEKLI